MEAYNLHTLISNYYLIVPEIQREYVWGAKENIEKLMLFIDDVLKSAQHKEKKNVGFLYSYKTGIEERDSHSVEHYIIDGQQRLTTLILLLYVLALKEGRIQDFQELLHSSDPTMKFSYNVRPLTEHFFRLMVNQNKCEQCIKENIWYTQDFERDVTITSMVNAVERLYEREDLISERLFDAVLTHIEFWYFDVKQTSQGEELYISMNSRGQKLTDSEQIKPRLLKEASEEQSKMWDEMEEFFFLYQNTQGRKIEAVDYAVNNFLKLVIEICTGDEINNIDPIKHSDKISIGEVLTGFDCIKYLFERQLITQKEKENLYENNIDRRFKYILEALLVGKTKGENDEELKRIKRLISNTLAYNPLIGHEKFYSSFLTPLKRKDGMISLYEYIVSEKDAFSGFIPPCENEKIDAILNGMVSEADIIQAEKYAFFDGRIHFLYHDKEGKVNWELFPKKLEAVIEYFDPKGVKSNYNPHLLVKFISLLDQWHLFWHFQYDCTKETWLKILVDETWQKPIHELLTTDRVLWDFVDFKSNLENAHQKQVQEELVKTNLLTKIDQGCYLYYQYENYVIHPYNAKADKKKYVIANIRNQILSELYRNQLIVSNQKLKDCDFFWGWDIVFSYKEKQFDWTWNNKLILVDMNIKKALGGDETKDSITAKLEDMLKYIQ